MGVVDIKTETNNVQMVRVGITKVFLEDFGENRGEITISDFEKGAFTYYWGSMGSDLKTFLKSTNKDYFARKLSTKTYVFDARRTVQNVRKQFKEANLIPWYKFGSAQKELRKAIKELGSANNGDEFIHMMFGLMDNLYYLELNYHEEKEFEGLIGDFFSCEPWNFIVEKTSDEYNWLADLHTKLIKQI